MTVLMVTNAKGGLSRPMAMTVIPQAQEMPIDELQQIGEEAGISGVHFAGIMSAFINHERCAARFSFAAARQVTGEDLRELHTELANTHMGHISILEKLMTTIGLDPRYVSPAARMASYLDEKLMQAPLLAGSVEQMTMELFTVEVALAMIGADHANADLLMEIAVEAQPSSFKDTLRAAAERWVADAEEAFEQIRSARQALLVEVALAETT